MRSPTITTEQEIPFKLTPRTAAGHVGRVYGDPVVTKDSGDWLVIEDPDDPDPLAFIAISPDVQGEGQFTIEVANKADLSTKISTTIQLSNEMPLAETLEVEFGTPRPKRSV